MVSRGDHPVDVDRAGLADAVGAVDGLGLGGGVPPRVEHEHVVGLGEGEPEPTRLERDEEHRGRALPERRDALGTVAGRAVEVLVGDALGLQPGPHDREEPGELREHQRAVPLLGQLLELLDERVDLGRRRQPGVRLVDQARVERHLPQHGQRPQDRDAVAVDVVDQPEQPLPLALEVPVVDRPVPRVQVDREHLLHLRRQLGGDGLLGAPQHQRTDAPTQRREPLGIPAVLDRLGPQLLEQRRPRVQPGRHDRQQRPEVHQRVLERGAGDGELRARREPAHRLVGLGLVVLHELRLVEHHRSPRRASGTRPRRCARRRTR